MDPVDDLSSNTGNFSDEVYEPHEDIYERIFLELFTLVGLASLAANVLIGFVILRFQKLRSDVTYKIIFNVSMLQAFLLLVGPLTLRAAVAIHMFVRVHLSVFCALYQLQYSAMCGMSMVFAIMICDWYIKLYQKNYYPKFCRIFVFLLVFVYTITVCFSIAGVGMCMEFFLLTHYSVLVMLCFMALLLIFVIAMNVVNAVKKRKLTNPPTNNLGLAIGNIFFISWCPILFLFILEFFGNWYGPHLLITAICIGLTSPIFNLLYLLKYDHVFSVFLRRVLKCQCNDYKNEVFEAQSVSYNDANGVRISDK